MAGRAERMNAAPAGGAVLKPVLKPVLKAALLAVLLAVAVVSLPGCGSVRMKAARVTLLVRDDGIVFGGPQDKASLIGGETVVLLRNDGARRHRIVLASVDAAADELPAKLLAADDPHDDNRIKGLTRSLKPKEAVFAGGGLGYKLDAESFHVYLRPGQTYTFFDNLADGSRRGVYLQVTPTAEGAQ
jgi:hypothetical protein